MNTITNTTVSFSITGEFITQQAKDFVMESNWNQALNFLMESLIGITWDQSISILKGEMELIGNSRDDSIEMVEVEEIDEEYQKQIEYLYGDSYVPEGSNVVYRPYGYVGSYSYKDLSYEPHREMYYIEDKINDIVRICKVEHDEITRELAVFFERTDYQLPPWIKPNRDAQKSCDNTHLRDVAEFYRKIEKADDEAYRACQEETEKCEIASDNVPNDSNASSFLASSLKAKGMNIDESMIDSLLGIDQPEYFGVSEHKDFKSGYIDRSGKFYGCGYAQHSLLSEWIVENIIKKEVKDAQIALDDLGWVRLQRSAFDTNINVMCEKKPTKKQIDSIFDHSLEYGSLCDKTQEYFFDNGGSTKIILKKD